MSPIFLALLWVIGFVGLFFALVFTSILAEVLGEWWAQRRHNSK